MPDVTACYGLFLEYSRVFFILSLKGFLQANSLVTSKKLVSKFFWVSCQIPSIMTTWGKATIFVTGQINLFFG